MPQPGTAAGGQPVGVVVFLAIGLLGGAHCIGMCGPLVSTYAGRLGADRERLRWVDARQHALFNAGRTLSYATIGALAGAVGGLLFDAAAVFAVARSVRGVTGVVVGALILATGARYLAGGTAAGDAVPGLERLTGRVTGLLTGRLDRWVEGPGIVLLGAVHGLLPCPLLYPAFLYAFARGSALEGGVALAALGLGTFPTLFLFGTVVQTVQTRTRVALHRVLGALFLLLGLVALLAGLRQFGVPVPHVPFPVYQPLSG